MPGSAHPPLPKPPDERVLLHVDVDAFLASVEQILRPALRGRPVVVGGEKGERNIVASCSYEAKRRGLRTGMTIAEAERRCPDAVFLKGDFAPCGRARDRMLRVLRRFSPAVAAPALDDAFVDLTGLRDVVGPPLDAASAIRRAVLDDTGLSVSIGIGTSLLVAKIASRLAKPAGVLRVEPGHERTFLAPLPVGDLPGVGRRTLALLERFQIRTVGDLAIVPLALLEETFGTTRGRALFESARGRGTDRVLVPAIPGSLSRETSLDPETVDPAILEGTLHYLVERAARRMRERGLVARTLRVKLVWTDYERVATSRTLREATDLDGPLFEGARDLLRRLRTRRSLVRLVGVTLTNLAPHPLRQPSLLPGDPVDREERLRRGVDRVRARFGFGALTVGASLHLLDHLPRTRDGFRLRTPSLTQ